MRRLQVCPTGERKERPAFGPLAMALLLAAATGLSLAACTTGNRPAWEQVAMGGTPYARSPARTGATTDTAGTSAAPRLAAPIGSGDKATSGRGSVEQVTLSPPGAPDNPTDAASGSVAAPAKTTASLTKPASAPTTIDPGWIGYETYVAKYEDTLLDLAVKHDLGFLELTMANRGVDPWLPGEGTTLVLPNMHLPPDAAPQGLVLNLPEQRLYYYEKGKLIRSYPIGIGRDGHATPLGSTTIVRKTVNPVWRPTPSARADDPTLPEVVPAGPDNPLGNRAMYLGWSTYLIHGTNKDYGVGRRASRGCIRMYPDDIVALYKKTPVGTKVTVVDQPVKVRWIGDDLYVEASPTLDQVHQWEDKGTFDPADPAAAKQLVLKAAGTSADRIDWSAFDRALDERRGLPTRITRSTTSALATASPTSLVPSASTSSTAPSPVSTFPSSKAPSSLASPLQSPASMPPAPPAASARSASHVTATAKPALPGPAVAKPVAAMSSESDDDLVRWLRDRLQDGSGH